MARRWREYTPDSGHVNPEIRLSPPQYASKRINKRTNKKPPRPVLGLVVKRRYIGEREQKPPVPDKER